MSQQEIWRIVQKQSYKNCIEIMPFVRYSLGVILDNVLLTNAQ